MGNGQHLLKAASGYVWGRLWEFEWSLIGQDSFGSAGCLVAVKNKVLFLRKLQSVHRSSFESALCLFAVKTLFFL